MLDPDQLASYLHYGFLPRVTDECLSQPWARARGADAAAGDRDLLADGTRAFRAACGELPTGTNVLPLSGGIDSRFLLGTLLEAGLRDSIVTVTFGTPGTSDYELGRRIARSVDVRHEAIDLTEVTVDREMLEDAVRGGGRWTYLYDAVYNHLIPRRLGADATYWSGVMANTINGAHVEVSLAPHETRRRFAENMRATPYPLAPTDYDPLAPLPDPPLVAASPLTGYEQLYLALRYGCGLLPALLREGIDYRTPFCALPWADFVVGLPVHERKDQSLYYRLATSSFPELFRIPTKKTHGARLGDGRVRVLLARSIAKAQRTVAQRTGWFPNPGLNYVDFAQALRKGGTLFESAREAIHDLERRKVIDWLSVVDLWEQHQAGRDLSKALRVAVGLEVNLSLLPPASP